jgi:4'-phosphopantetheinyl transferase EntD
MESASVPGHDGSSLAGRRSAASALIQLGVLPEPVTRGPAGEPRFQRGVVGTITHCRGLAAAAVASDVDFEALGIDIERVRDLRRGVLRRIATGTEEAWIIRQLDELHELAAPAPYASSRTSTGDPLTVALFSAKESVYKAWFGRTGQRLRFQDVQIVVDDNCTDTPASRRRAAIRVPGDAADVATTTFRVEPGDHLSAPMVPGIDRLFGWLAVTEGFVHTLVAMPSAPAV